MLGIVIKKYLTGLFVIVALCLFSQQSPNAGLATIKGKIAGMSKGQVTVTAEIFGQKQTFDAAVSNEEFEVKVNQPSPTLYSLMLKEDPTDKLIFFADNGVTTIRAIKGSLVNGAVSGSPSNDELIQYNMMVGNYDNMIQHIRKVYSELESGPKYERIKDSLETAFEKTMNQKISSVQDWILKHNTSFVSPLLIAVNYGNEADADAIRPLYDKLSADVKASYYGNYVSSMLARLEGLNVGKMAPLFSQDDPDGNPVSLESFRGKYVLIDFWASWCGPCRAENPNVVRTYQKFKDKGFEVLGVSLDNNHARWIKAIEDDQLTWPQVSDLKYWRNEVAVQYGVQSIPANFLLDKDGKIIAKGLRGSALEQTLDRLLR